MKKFSKYFRNSITAAILILAISAINAAAATFTVTNTNDSGAGSLRDAINQTNTNAQADTINFDPTVFNVARTITLTSGEIAISPDGTNPGRLLTINGPGANLLTISGNNASRIFLLGPQFNANVTMSGMTLRDGNGISSVASSGNGGAIHLQVAASLTLNSMVIRNNVVTGLSGGAIYSNTSRNIEMNDSLITENSADTVGGLNMTGNDNDYTFTMRNTVVSNNTASRDIGGISITRGIIVIENSGISGNTAPNFLGGIGIYFASKIDISDTLIDNNSSVAQGGIVIDRCPDANLRRVRITNNSTGEFGAGLSIALNSGSFNLIDSTVSNNAATSFGSFGGGINVSAFGIVKIINTTISGNSVGIQGGGILFTGPGLELINSTVVNNSTRSTGSGGRGGGGIFDGELGRTGGNEFGDRVKLQNSIIAGNTAATGIGPDLYSGFNSAGYNIIGNTANTNNSTANTGDLFNVNPQVGALADNGGPTRTHALLTGSPAINAGSNALAVDQNGSALLYDQRGVSYDRIFGGTVDIGAYERQPASVSGRVQTPSGLNLRNARVLLTDPQGVTTTVTTGSFGLYSFTNIPLGGPYVVSVSSKRYRFAPKVMIINSNLTNLDFVGLE